MDRETALQEVKQRYADILEPAKKKVKGKNTYICPLCSNGTGRDGDGLVIDPHGDGTQLKCFKCGFYGDIVDLYQKQHDCDFNTALNALCDRLGISIDNATYNADFKPYKNTKNNKDMDVKESKKDLLNEPETAINGTADYTNYYIECHKRLSDPAAQHYLLTRGITNEVANRFYLGYDPESDPAGTPGGTVDEYKPHPCPRLIIPCSKSHYIGRRTDGKTEYKVINAGNVDIFNLKALDADDMQPIFITEGWADALSIIEADGVAIALNSTANTRKLLEVLAKKKIKKTLILSLDNDDSGEKATNTLAAGLRNLNISYVVTNIAGSHKDANEALTSDRQSFIKGVQDAKRRISKPDNTADYIAQFMQKDISDLQAQGNRKTGFNNLDKEQGSIYAGLYVVGGLSSVGKTTFISQMADQMAAAWQHVLFFSMEQSRLEMVSKSIARQTAKDNPNKAVSSLQIRTGAKGESISDAIKEYSNAVGDRVSIIEGNFNCTVGFIKGYVQQYIQNNGIRPCVFIDYLQVIQAEVDPETGRKATDTRQITEHNVTELKRMSRALEIPVFIISSINRGNYLTPISFESFKETGGIEYTADVVYGLQLAAIHDDLFNKEGHIKEKRERIENAKAENPRRIELVCLKNRYGKSSYSCMFNYYPAYDLYAESDDTDNATSAARWDNVPRK